MPVDTDEIDVTELEEFFPSRVDGVGKGANGFPVLMIKKVGDEVETTGATIDEAVAEVDKATRPDCATCDGTGKSEGAKCMKCFGSGKAPKVGESAKAYIEAVAKEKGVAASGQPVPPADRCPTCKGTGHIDGGKECPDCDGSGKDAHFPPDDKMNEREGFGGAVSEGDPQHREKVDKAMEEMFCDDEDCSVCKALLEDDDPETLEKKRLSYKRRKKLPEGAFALPGRRYPIHDESHARNALARVSQHGTPEEKAKVRAAVRRRYPGIEVSKSLEERYGVTESDYMEKRDFDPNVGGGVDRDKLPASDFAGKDRSFPVVTQADVSDALASIGRAGSDNYDAATLKRNILRIARRKGFKVPEADEKDDAKKADGTMFSGPNPQLAAMATKVGGDDDDCVADGPGPGSPEWEGVDAATAEAAAIKLMEASELIRTFAQREAIEIAAGEGNDIFDTFAAEQALCSVSGALGVMAQMAFHEGLEAKKSVGDDDVEKAGRRLSMQTVEALSELRDHLTNLLGDDDPAKSEDDEANKAVAINVAELAKEIENMTTDELTKVLDARDEKLVGIVAKALKGDKAKRAKKGKSKMDETASVARGKAAHKRGRAEGDDAVEDDDDLEDEAEQGTSESASGTRNADGGAKAVLTREEIEAEKAVKDARKAHRAAKKAKKQAAENAAVQKALEESKAAAEAAVKALEERVAESDARLAAVEKMAAPSDIVRTRPTQALKASAERDALELQLGRCEQMAKAASDSDVRREYSDRAKALRAKLAALNSNEV
jgi:hypothetical protein